MKTERLRPRRQSGITTRGRQTVGATRAGGGLGGGVKRQQEIRRGGEDGDGKRKAVMGSRRGRRIRVQAEQQKASPEQVANSLKSTR
eukprot:6208706-Pleurochrysis_carterae.AAC.1